MKIEKLNGWHEELNPSLLGGSFASSNFLVRTLQFKTNFKNLIFAHENSPQKLLIFTTIKFFHYRPVCPKGPFQAEIGSLQALGVSSLQSPCPQVSGIRMRISANLIFSSLQGINVHSTHTLLIHTMVHRASSMIKNSPVAFDSFHINQLQL